MDLFESQKRGVTVTIKIKETKIFFYKIRMRPFKKKSTSHFNFSKNLKYWEIKFMILIHVYYIVLVLGLDTHCSFSLVLIQFDL